MADSTVVRADDAWAESAKPLTPGQFDVDDGTSFGWYDRLFLGHSADAVFTYSDWEARDLTDMLKRDYTGRQIEAALTYPTMSCDRSFKAAKGDSGEFEFVQAFWEADPFNGGPETPLDLIIDQMTSSVVFKKAFWELVWTRGVGDFDGKVVYKRVAWRPQTVTRSLHHPRSGSITGWQQDPYVFVTSTNKFDGKPVEVLGNRSFVHVHGGRRDPINGVSDLEVTYWAYKTKQKILFLLAQFLEGVSLPRVLVKAQDGTVSQQVARSIAAARNSGVIPVNVDGRPDSVDVQALDLSGNGADQFMNMLKWLDQAAQNSVMAGFLGLSNSAGDGHGSLALSSDASDFFLMTLESKHREYEWSLRNGLIAPLVRQNFGPQAKVPKFKFAPLNSEDKTAAVQMLQALMGSRDPALIPDEFLQQLVTSVSDYLGMDGEKLGKAFEGSAEKARQVAQQAQANSAAVQVAGVAGTVGAATRAVTAAKEGKDPVKAAQRGGNAATKAAAA